MSTFVYEDNDGVLHERTFPIGKAPREIPEEGLKRHWGPASLPAPVRAVEGVTRGHDRHFMSRQLPRWHPDAPRHCTDKNSPDYGKPQFSTPREVNDFVDKANARAEKTQEIAESQLQGGSVVAQAATSKINYGDGLDD